MVLTVDLSLFFLIYFISGRETNYFMMNIFYVLASWPLYAGAICDPIQHEVLYCTHRKKSVEIGCTVLLVPSTRTLDVLPRDLNCLESRAHIADNLNWVRVRYSYDLAGDELQAANKS